MMSEKEIEYLKMFSPSLKSVTLYLSSNFLAAILAGIFSHLNKKI
jgi:hypothetical protein